VSADSRALAPHSLRERDLARCSQGFDIMAVRP
jgi:hypothetical protein